MTPTSDNSLQHLLETARDASLSLALYDLASGYQLLVHPDATFHPASTIKLCVLLEVFHQASQGRFSPDDLLTVRNSFHSIANLSEFALSPEDDSEPDLYQHIGEGISLRELTRRMIVHSSNLATNLLVEKVGAANITRFMQELGAKDLVVLRGAEDKQAYALGLNNSATARSLMQVLVRLAKRSVVDEAASDEMVAILRQQQHNEGIPALLPEGVSVAHKTGWIDKHFHDAAIVYPPQHVPYVLVIMTEGFPQERQAHALVAGLSLAIYDQLITH